MIKKPKLMVMGHAGHGKDQVCRLLGEIFGLTSISSSLYALEHVVYPVLQPLYGYQSLDECYQDRCNHRPEWFDLIRDYNTPDGCRLSRDLYAEYDIYNGVRNIEEYLAIREAGLFDYSIWVDSSKRVPAESIESCSVTIEDANIILPNHGPLYQTTRQLIKLMITLYPQLRLPIGATY
jgi:hypothetical protein